MTGKTHRFGGMFCAILGFLLLKWKGLLLESVHPLIQLMIIYPFASWGSIVSDEDHHWASCPDKNVPNYIINRLLHLTTPTYKKLDKSLTTAQKRTSGLYKFTKTFSANHRSWQTHSDLTLLLSAFVLHCSLRGNFYIFSLNEVETTVVSLAVTGAVLGIIAHFILDMLTTDGIWVLLFVLINKLFGTHLPEKVGFVPRSSRFRTGGGWETFVRMVLTKATYVATIILIIELIYPQGLRMLYDSITTWISSFDLSFK